MLILTRKVDQGIIIAGNIHIRVLGVQRDRVKIGISAPLEITVLREELVANEGDTSPTTARNEDGTDLAKAEDPSLATSQEKRPENEG